MRVSITSMEGLNLVFGVEQERDGVEFAKHLMEDVTDGCHAMIDVK